MLLLFLFFPLRALHAQGLPPRLVSEAAHCLVAGERTWLDTETVLASKIYLAYRLDTHTLVGGEYLYLAVYNSRQRKAGRIFDIRVEDRHQYRIQNAASFVLRGKRVEFTELPAGDAWTRDQFEIAIRQMAKHKWYAARTKYLRKPNRKIECVDTTELK